MQSFWLHKWARTPNSEPSRVGITVWGYCHIPMDSIPMSSNTLYMSNVDVQEAVWVGCQPQPWHDIILTPKWARTPKSEPSKMGITAWGYCHMPMDSIQTLCICLMWMGKQFDVAVSLNHDLWQSFWLNEWARTPKSDTSNVVRCMPKWLKNT